MKSYIQDVSWEHDDTNSRTYEACLALMVQAAIEGTVAARTANIRRAASDTWAKGAESMNHDKDAIRELAGGRGQTACWIANDG